MRLLTFEEMISPMIYFSILSVILLISLYSYLKFNRKEFLAICILLGISVLFLFLKSIYIYLILTKASLSLALQFSRFYELVPVLFLIFLPYFLDIMIKLPSILKKLNNGFFISGMAISVFIILSALMFPESFQSVTHPEFPIKQEIYAGRGIHGPLFVLRDAVSGVYILWTGFLLVISHIRKDERIANILTIIGLAAAMFLTFFDIIESLSGEYLILNNFHISRFDIGISIFGLLSFISVLQHFMKYVKKNEELTQILDLQKNQLYQQANFDQKTSLYNRRIFHEKLKEIVVSGDSVGVIIMDLEGFHDLNEAFGFQVGDEILLNVAKRIIGNSRPNDMSFRMGNDEFSIIVTDLQSKDFLRRYVEVLHAALTQPYVMNGQDYLIQMSMGIVTLPEEARSAEDVISHLFTSLRSAKFWKNKAVFFNPNLRKEQERKVVVAHQLMESLKKNEFYILYQPIVNNEKDIVAVESLVRCKSDFFPGEFIPLAEQAGMMQELGSHILNLVIHDLISHPQFPYRVYINLSHEQFKDDDFATMLLARLRASGIDHRRIGFEISEHFIQRFEDHALNNLQKLHDEGIGLSLDRFGSGYSSLSSLESLPIDNLKIDKVLTLSSEDQSRKNNVMSYILELAKMFNLNLIAEMVEEDEDFQRLCSLGIHYFQGYLFFKPQTIEELLKSF